MIQLPAVEPTPLPSLFAGQYHEEATALRPAQAGDPWLRVVSAYDIRGAWDLGSWHEVLMGDRELALCIDVQTLPRAKALLASKGAAFEEYDISMGGPQRAEMIQRAGGRTTVPQIFIDGAHIGGSDDLAALDRRGGLDPLLAG